MILIAVAVKKSKVSIVAETDPTGVNPFPPSETMSAPNH